MTDIAAALLEFSNLHFDPLYSSPLRHRSRDTPSKLPVSTMVTSILLGPLRALSLGSKRAAPTLLRTQQPARTVSHLLSSRPAEAPALRSLLARPSQTQQSEKSTIQTGLVSQQTRGMKVHSSIKRRCEHCKVCEASNDLFPGRPDPDVAIALDRQKEGRKTTQWLSICHLQRKSET